MKDDDIIALYFSRSEEAIRQTEKKYGPLCRHIAGNILNNNEDVNECLNDSWLALWDQIPPERPGHLRAYICRIVRNTALKRYRDDHTQKRDPGGLLPLDELLDHIPAKDDTAREIETGELTRAIETFLDSLSAEKRALFIKRYWFCESVKEIAGELGIGERHASVRIGRVRKHLLRYLEQEGWL